MNAGSRRWIHLSGALVALALSACGGGGGSSSEANWYYHFVCNGDSECLSTNFAGTSSGTSDSLGPGQGGQSSCNGLLTFGRINWNIPPAQQWCDNSPTLIYPAPTLTLTVAPASVVAGHNAALSWSSSNTSSCTASGAWTGSKSLSGNVQVTPAAGTYTYVLECTGPGGSISRSVTLTVTPVVTLAVSPASVAVGQSATLTWSSSDTTSCTASGAWSGAKALSGDAVVTPAAGSYTYTLSCIATGGTTGTASATLAVVPQITLTVLPDTISLGGSATVEWMVQGATGCTASTLFCSYGNTCNGDSSFSGSKATSGSEGKTPATGGTYTYSLGCSGAGGSSEASAVLSVNPPSGTTSSVRFTSPAGITTDSANNLYVGDGTYRIRKITPGGVVTTFAGSGTIASNDYSNDGEGAIARFRDLLCLSTDGSDNIHLAEYYLQTIRKVTPGATVSTYAGQEYTSGSTDGSGAAARFNGPQGIGADKASGIVYVSDTTNRVIRKIATDGTVSTLAGAVSQQAWTDGTGSSARFFAPEGIVTDASGNLYVTDASMVRKVTPSGDVTTFASGSGLGNLHGIAMDSSGNLYVANAVYSTILKITSAGVVSTFAGTFGVSGSADGSGTAATFNYPYGLATDSANNVYVTDRNNHTVRKITPTGDVTTYAGLAGASGSGN